MDILPLDIREQRFKIRFRGFDIREVDSFLEQIADGMESLQEQVRILKNRLAEKERALEESKQREATLRAAATQSKNVMQDLQKNAEKEAELTITKAEVTAEKILNNAHNRLAQLHEDITELKRQRTHFELKLRSYIEAQLKFLDMEKESNRDADEMEDKLRFIRKT
jgi:cell division initiation protein